MTCSRRLSLAAVLAALSILFTPAGWAQTDSCSECKYLRCLKSTAERKKKLVEVYRGIQNFWAPHVTYDTGAPLQVVDFGALPASKRSQWHGIALSQLMQYATMEESRTASIPAPEGCGYASRGTGSSEGIEADTHAISCEIRNLPTAMGAQPCKELADLIARHEGLHQRQCEERKKPVNQTWTITYVDKQGRQHTAQRPPKILTPYGAAAGEIAAYQVEIAALQPIIDKLEKNCRKLSFKNVTLDCTIRTPRCRLRTGQKISGSVCGDPTQETWTIETHYFTEGCGAPPSDTRGDKPYDNDCVKAGSAEEKQRAAIYSSARGMGGGGWMCVYNDTPRPQITIRSFRPSVCEGGAEQTITVDAVVGDKCEQAPPPPPVRPLPNS